MGSDESDGEARAEARAQGSSRGERGRREARAEARARGWDKKKAGSLVDSPPEGFLYKGLFAGDEFADGAVGHADDGDAFV